MWQLEESVQFPTHLFLLFQIKADQLAVTKISERGKKQKKNWTTVWSELTSEQLTFYKQQQQTATNQVLQFCLPLSFDVLWFNLMSSYILQDVFVFLTVVLLISRDVRWTRSH